MTDTDGVVNSPVGWVAEHIQRYVESDGEDGQRWSGVDTLLITTRGRKTGTPYRTALIYGRDGDDYVVVASNGGSRRHPNWYRNLLQNPEVDVQVGAERFRAHARPATAGERPRLWTHMTAIWPDYDAYQQRTEREIPVVVIERR